MEQPPVSEHPAHTIRSPGGELEAAFVPSLAMLGCSLAADGTELLDQRGGVEAYAEHGSTMGIPLLHPWANRLAEPSYRVGDREVAVDTASPLVHTDGNGLAIHGCHPAAMPFAIAKSGDHELTAVLDTTAAPAVLELFPFPHRLTMEARLDGRELRLTTTLEAGGDVPVPVAFGHHPYLRLPGLPRDEWRITLPDMSRLKLDRLMIPTGRRLPRGLDDGPLGGRDLDDAFADVADGATFSVEGGGRRITVRFLEGYRFAQVYSPRDSSLICFEPMTAPGNALRSGDGLQLLAPGQTHCGSFVIEVSG
jgi:galactose mutarotase-like enzyme